MYITVLTFDKEVYIIEASAIEEGAISRAERLFNSLGLIEYDDTIEPFTYLYRYSLVIDNVEDFLPYKLVYGCNNGYYSVNVYEVQEEGFSMSDFIQELTS